MKSYLRALSFLTVIPLPHMEYSREGKELSTSASCFPLAGATLGLILALTAWLLSHLLPGGPVAALALGLSFLLTRGLHVDGLADSADGLLGTTSREKAFRAMDDSAVGVMGAGAFIFIYLLKFSLLASSATHLMVPALVLMPLAGRWAIVFAGVFFDAARKNGLGDLFLDGLRLPILLRASLGVALVMVFFYLRAPQLFLPALPGLALALAGAYFLALHASGRLGGINGDILGACSEVGEALFLAGFFGTLQFFS